MKVYHLGDTILSLKWNNLLEGKIQRFRPDDTPYSSGCCHL